MRFGRASTERDERENTDDSALASSSSSSAPLREIDGFRFIRSLATARISTADDYERARDRALAVAAGAFITSAAVTAGVVARARSRTKAERDLPPGTHWRAAATATRALATASLASGTCVCAVGLTLRACGVTTVEDLRRELRAGTRRALEATPGGLGRDR